MNTTHQPTYVRQARAILLFMAVILVASFLAFARAQSGMDDPTPMSTSGCTTDTECGCTLDCLD